MNKGCSVIEFIDHLIKLAYEIHWLKVEVRCC